MPIYEYRAVKQGCSYCRKGFDVLQKISEAPLVTCPRCGGSVRKAVSMFRANVIEDSEQAIALENKLKEYESEGKWSHAAELADKAGLDERAHNNYKKAGYNF